MKIKDDLDKEKDRDYDRDRDRERDRDPRRERDRDRDRDRNRDRRDSGMSFPSYIPSSSLIITLVHCHSSKQAWGRW